MRRWIAVFLLGAAPALAAPDTVVLRGMIDNGGGALAAKAFAPDLARFVVKGPGFGKGPA